MKYINIHTHQLQSPIDEHSVFNHSIGKDTEYATYYTAGIHPRFIDETNYEAQLTKLQEAVTSTNCVGVGECGIDKLKGTESSIQEKIFIEHIRLAKKINKPLIIHCVKAFQEVLKCLRIEKFEGSFIIHGFNSNLEQAKPFLKMPNAYFSFGSALIQNGSNAELLIKILPLNRFFLETDDKAISIKNIYDAAVEINGISEQSLSQQIINNYKKVFVHGLD